MNRPGERDETYDVFLSYNQADKDSVRKLAEAWRQLGLKVFFAEGSLEPGTDIKPEVEQGIRSSRRVVVFITANSVKSRWVAFEATLATAYEEQVVIPVLLEPIPRQDWPVSLESRNPIDLADLAQQQREYGRLMKSLGVEKAAWPSFLESANRQSLRIIGRNAEQRAFNAMLSGDCRLLSVSGIGGIGKSTLFQAFRNTCVGRGYPTAIVNSFRLRALGSWDRYPPAVAAIQLVVDDLKNSECALPEVLAILERYQNVYDSVAEKAATNGPTESVRMFLRAGNRTADAWPLPAFQDESQASLTAAIEHVERAVLELRSREERELCLRPVGPVSQALVKDLNRGTHQPVALFFDELEMVSDDVELWLKGLFWDHYGQLDERVKLLIASQRQLDSSWRERSAELRYRHEHLPLEGFSSKEVREYLDTQLPHEVRERLDLDQLVESLGNQGQLPVLLALESENLRTDPRSNPPGAAAQSLVERLLRSTQPTEAQRDALLAGCIARNLDFDVLRELLDDRNAQLEATFEWLGELHFVNRHASGLAFHDVVREIFLKYLTSRQPQYVLQQRETLARYYDDLSKRMRDRQEGLDAAVEHAYHTLSAARPESILQLALNSFLEALPHAISITGRWCAMLRQVVYEGRGSLLQSTQSELRRLADILESWSSLRAGFTFGDAELIEPAAMGVFFTNMFRSDRPSVEPQNAYYWLEYFEARVGLAGGGGFEKHRATSKLESIWESAKLHEDPGTDLLRFCLASDIGESYTRFGQIGKAIKWNQLALELAEKRTRHLQKALALYQLATNYKRLGNYGLALDYANQALELFEKHEPTNRYHRGKLLLDKANTLTYLNEWQAAEAAYDSAQQFLQPSSRQSRAELLHRRGWLLRMSGELVESLARHKEAVAGFDEPLNSRDTTSVALIPSLRAKALHSMANTEAEMNEFDDALQHYDEALAVFTHEGSQRHEAIARKDRAWSCLQASGPQAAIDDLNHAIEQLSRTDVGNKKDVAHLAEAFLTRARIRVRSSELGSALRDLDEAAGAVAVAADNQNTVLLATIRVTRALVLTLGGQCEQARKLLRDMGPPDSLPTKLAAEKAVVEGTLALQIDQDPQPHFEEALQRARHWNDYLSIGLEQFIQLIPSILAASPSLEIPSEDLDYYDADGTFLGTASSQEVHRLGLWHRTFHCWIGDRSDTGDCRLLFQQRGHKKTDYADYLDMSVAGHYHAGEGGLQGGLRECKEELDLEVDPDQLQHYAIRKLDESLENGRINREFQDIYALSLPLDLTTLRPGFPEVRGVFWLPLEPTCEVLERHHSSVDATGRAANLETEEWFDETRSVTYVDFIPEAVSYLRVVLEMMADVLKSLPERRRDQPPFCEGRLADNSWWQPMENGQ